MEKENCAQKFKKISPVQKNIFGMVNFSKKEKVSRGFSKGNPISVLFPHKKVRKLSSNQF